MSTSTVDNKYEYKLRHAGIAEPLSTYLADPVDPERLEAGFPAFQLDESGAAVALLGPGGTPVALGGGGAATWGTVTGTLANQTDLNNALNAKQATLISGTNIKTVNGVSVLGTGDIVISGGGGSPETDFTEITASRSVVATDLDDFLSLNSSSAIVLTIENDATLALAGMTKAKVLTAYRSGSGAISFVAGAGVTIVGTPPSVSQYETITLIRTAVNTWSYMVGTSGSNGVPIAFTSRALVSSDNGANLICSSAQIATINIGLPSGFGVSFKGTISTAGTATVNDIRTTGAANPWCALSQIGADTYDLVGTKA